MRSITRLSKAGSIWKSKSTLRCLEILSIRRLAFSNTRYRQSSAARDVKSSHIKPRLFESEASRDTFFSQFPVKYTFPMFSVTTVTHHTDDTQHPSILLTNRDGHKYLFGKVPEGAQRVITESKIRLGKLKLVFLTGTISSWLDIGGLPGLFLTMTDATSKGLDVFAPCERILSYIVATWRSFVFRKGMDLNIIPTSECGIFADSNISIKTVRISSGHSSSLKVKPETDTQLKKLASLMFPRDTSKVNSEDPDSYKSDPTDTESHTHAALPAAADYLDLKSQDSVSYMVRFLPLRGKFDVQRAKSLGLSPGPKFSLLADGISVENDAGETILPEQVMLPPVSFQKLLIIDIPNKSYLENTLASPKWHAKDANVGDEEIGLVYHFLGKDIDFRSKKYQRFIHSFPTSCNHVISHPSTASNTLVFKRAAENLLTLKCVQPMQFNLSNAGENPLAMRDRQYLLHQLQEFTILPTHIGYSENKVSKTNWSLIYDAIIPSLLLPGIDKKLVIEAAPLSLEMNPLRLLRDQVHVITLGTGLAMPSIFRNVISTLVRVPYLQDGQIQTRLILLDGGENTIGSLLRNFGHGNGEQLRRILGELSLIFLSHLHADHHLGLVTVMKEWLLVNQSNKKQLYLVAPWQYDTFKKEWFGVETQNDSDLDWLRVCYISCEDFLSPEADRRSQYKKISIEEFERRFDSGDGKRLLEKESLRPIDSANINQMYALMGIRKIEVCRAIHCAWAYSVSITLALDSNDTFKVSYSGDTRPNPRFASIGYNSDLLVHESSLDSDLIEEALAKKHSTMIEALAVARFMNCPKVILTHFSTRYSNSNDISTAIPRLQAESTKLEKYLTESNAKPNIFAFSSHGKPVKEYGDLSICFAFDFMNVRYDSVDCQRAVQDVISRIFSSDDPIDDDKKARETERVTAKREAKRTARLAKKRKNSA